MLSLASCSWDPSLLEVLPRRLKVAPIYPQRTPRELKVLKIYPEGDPRYTKNAQLTCMKMIQDPPRDVQLTCM